MRISSSILVLAVSSIAASQGHLDCKDAKWNVRTCCKNQLEYVERYDGNFLAYYCSYKKFAVIDPAGGWTCGDSAINVCCNMKDGWIAPLGNGFEHSEPRNFACDGLSISPEDEPPV